MRAWAATTEARVSGRVVGSAAVEPMVGGWGFGRTRGLREAWWVMYEV